MATETVSLAAERIRRDDERLRCGGGVCMFSRWSVDLRVLVTPPAWRAGGSLRDSVAYDLIALVYGVVSRRL